jgi:hypothetical protein
MDQYKWTNVKSINALHLFPFQLDLSIYLRWMKLDHERE